MLVDPVFDFVGVGQGGVVVKADEVGKIVYAGNVAIGKNRLNGVLVTMASQRAVEIALQGRRTKLHRKLTRVAADAPVHDIAGGVERISVVCGPERCGSGDAQPYAKMEGNRDGRRKFGARHKILRRNELVIAEHRAGKAGER